MKLPHWLVERLFDWAWKHAGMCPDLKLETARNGGLYMNRWHIIRSQWLNIYLHEFNMEEAHEASHDHPYDSVSIILGGGYREVFLDGRSRVVQKGDVVFRRATAAHRIVPDYPEHVTRHNGVINCWSLFVTGPRVRDWFFYQNGKTIQHAEFVP